MTVNKQLLCSVDDIPEDGCKGFTINYQQRELDIFILKRSEKIFAYRNHCPHTGANLNWQPDTFMDYENLYIQCAIHGARFEVETGLCVWGPCVRQSLIKVKFHILENNIYLEND